MEECAETNIQTTIEYYNKTLDLIDSLIKVRKKQLGVFEKIVLEKLYKHEISLLNLSSKKGKVSKGSRENTHLQLECKIIRRNIFFLCYRRDFILEAINKLQQPHIDKKDQHIEL